MIEISIMVVFLKWEVMTEWRHKRTFWGARKFLCLELGDCYTCVFEHKYSLSLYPEALSLPLSPSLSLSLCIYYLLTPRCDHFTMCCNQVYPSRFHWTCDTTRFINHNPFAKFNGYFKIPVFINFFTAFQALYRPSVPHYSSLTRLPVSAASLPFHALTWSWPGFLVAQKLPLYTLF